MGGRNYSINVLTLETRFLRDWFGLVIFGSERWDVRGSVLNRGEAIEQDRVRHEPRVTLTASKGDKLGSPWRYCDDGIMRRG